MKIDKINSFLAFHDVIANSKDQQWNINWNAFIQSNLIAFYRLSATENDVKISFKIIINHDLKVQIYKNDTTASRSESNWLLDDNQLENWSQFNELLNYYADEPEISVQSSPINSLKAILMMIEEIQSSADVERLIEPLKDMIRGVISTICERKLPEFILIEAVESLEEDQDEGKCQEAEEPANCELNVER